jgi:hypothetical protein
MTKRKWTKTEIRTMKSLAGKKKARAIAHQLRRSECAIVQKAFTLGLSLSMR